MGGGSDKVWVRRVQNFPKHVARKQKLKDSYSDLNQIIFFLLQFYAEEGHRVD